MDYITLAIVLLILTVIALAIDIRFKHSKILQLKEVKARQESNIIALQGQLIELKQKPKSKELLEMLSEINSGGTLLSISRVDQDNIYFHQNGR